MLKILKNFTAIASRSIIPAKLATLERSIEREETKLFPSFNGKVSVRINGPRFPVYEPTSCALLVRYFEKMGNHRIFSPKKDGYKIAVLGSGLGKSCAALSCVDGINRKPLFETVVGFEIDKKMASASKKIFKENGIKNIKILNSDFMDADLERFDAVFLFKPFMETPYRFVRKLKSTGLGTVVISRDFPYSPIGGMMMITVLDNNSFDPGEFLMINNGPLRIGDANFFTYVRR